MDYFRQAVYVLTLAVVAATGCRRDDSVRGMRPDNGFRTSVHKGVIALSVLTLDNPFFRQIGQSMVEEGQRHGYSVRVESGEFDVATQETQVRRFIREGAVAIVLTPCDSWAIGPAILEANQAGIPVFTADIACLATNARVVTHVATDNYGGGKQAAHAMIEAVGEQGGRVAIIGHRLIESSVMRVRGFKDIIAKYNGGRTSGKLEIVAEEPGGTEWSRGRGAVERLLREHTELAGIFAVNDPSALGARAALQKAGRTGIIIVGFDGSREGKAAVKAGELYATPVQYPDQIGIETVRAIVRHFNGEALPTEMLIPTSLYQKKHSKMQPAE